MNTIIRMTIGCLLVLGSHATAQSTTLRASPWLAAADDLPPFPRHIDLDLVVDRDKIGAYEPVIARITLTNRNEEPVTLRVRKDGAPHVVASLVARGNDPFERHHQRLQRSGPESQQISLAPGESTTGEILVLFGGSPTGFPFAEPGWYRVQFACQPDSRFAPVHSNQVVLTVLRGNAGNPEFLDELDEITYAYYEYDRETTIRQRGEDYHVGIQLLKKIINQDSPYHVDLEDKRETALIDALTKLLERYPNSLYSAYLARYLAFMHLETVAGEFSLGRHAVREKADPSTWDASACLGDPSYQKALRYLTMADKANLWPRTTVVAYLAWLYMIPQDWEKLSICCHTLRTKYSELGGARLADELERGMEKYQDKVRRWKKEAHASTKER